MPRRRYKPEEIVAKLRQGDVLVNSFSFVSVVCLGDPEHVDHADRNCSDQDE